MSDTKKGFNVTIGVVFALFVVFVILPIGTCVGCTMCTAGLGAVGQVAQEEQLATEAKLEAEQGPAITVENVAFKVLDENPFLHEVTYKFDAVNHRNRMARTGFSIQFLDADGLVIDEDLKFSETVPANASRTFTGKTMTEPAQSGRIQSMTVTRQ